jgi:hypothetical protein
MLVFRRHPLTGREIWQDLTELRNTQPISVDELSPGRALSEDVPKNEQLPPEAHAYPVRSFSLSAESNPDGDGAPIAAEIATE